VRVTSFCDITLWCRFWLCVSGRRTHLNTPSFGNGSTPLQKIMLIVTHPFKERRFRQISLNSVADVRASKKSSIIANRKSTTRFTSSHRWTLCVTPKSPKGWVKTRIFTFGVAFHFFVAGNHRHFKFGMWVEHSKSQPTVTKRPWNGRGYVT